MTETSLIDLKALSQPAVKLIDAISKGIGTIYEPLGIKRKAKAEAEAALIFAHTQKELTEIETRAMNRVLQTEVRRQLNIDQIVKKAIDFLPESTKTTESVDSDWIADFFNICQDCSHETLQFLWAKLLADEVDRPGRYSRRTIHTIKLLNVEEANLFTKLCCCVWNISEDSAGTSKALIMDTDKAGRYSDSTWDFDGAKITLLEHIDLAEYQFFDLDIRKSYEFDFFSKKHFIKPQSDDERLEIVTLSPVGEELFDICGSVPNEEYYNITLKYFIQRNLLKQI